MIVFKFKLDGKKKQQHLSTSSVHYCHEILCLLTKCFTLTCKPIFKGVICKKWPEYTGTFKTADCRGERTQQMDTGEALNGIRASRNIDGLRFYCSVLFKK